MGAGASAGMTAGLQDATEEDLKELLKAMPAEDRQKVSEALRSARVAAGDIPGPAAEPLPVAEGDSKPTGASTGPAKRKPCIGGNWKCNPDSIAKVKELCAAFKGCKFDAANVDVIICCATIHGYLASEELAGSGIELGVQNISKTGCGAYTGEVTSAMAMEMGFTWCLIGHSERRTKYGETDEDTFTKLTEAQTAGLKIMFCIGESLEEREKGVTDDVNKRQLDGALPLVKDWDKFVIAYEPVWAIGTGKVATPDQAQETQASIRKFVSEKCGADVAAKVRIQYGGSASPDNIEGLACKDDIDGFLVGGASLKPEFTKMIEHLNVV